MRFPYHQYPRNPSPAFPNDTSYLVPLLPVVVKNGSKEFEIDALADSGASGCLFPGMLGEGLGLDVRRGPTQRIHGLGKGIVTAHFHEVTLQIGNIVWREYVGFAFEHLGIDGILGQRGFFSKFRVVFDHDSLCVIVRKKSPTQKLLTTLGL